MISVWIRAALFIAVVPGMVGGWLPWMIAGRPLLTSNVVLAGAGTLLLVLGWAVLLWCATDFAQRGKGTPAPYDPPRLLVVGGLYRYVRNPMYVGVVTAIVGQAAMFQSLALLGYAVAVIVVFHLTVVLYEEPRLRSSFGNPYMEYCMRVPRWVPKPP